MHPDLTLPTFDPAARRDVLYMHDRPVAYLRSDAAGTPHLFVLAEAEPEADWETWIAVPITEAAAHALRTDPTATLAGACQSSHAPVWCADVTVEPHPRLVGARLQPRADLPDAWWPR